MIRVALISLSTLSNRGFDFANIFRQKTRRKDAKDYKIMFKYTDQNLELLNYVFHRI